jgi:prepilin-type N-terminal cleavage/methylation domain-containing protein
LFAYTPAAPAGVYPNHKEELVIKSNKGFTLPEVLLALLLIGILSVIITELLVFNAASTTAHSKFGRQQFTIHDAFTRLNRDIEEAVSISLDNQMSAYDYKTIILTVGDTSREWTIDSGVLYLGSQAVVEGLSSESKFTRRDDCLTVVLKPEPTNEGRYALNMAKPIVTQYSLTYKK